VELLLHAPLPVNIVQLVVTNTSVGRSSLHGTEILAHGTVLHTIRIRRWHVELAGAESVFGESERVFRRVLGSGIVELADSDSFRMVVIARSGQFLGFGVLQVVHVELFTHGVTHVVFVVLPEGGEGLISATAGVNLPIVLAQQDFFNVDFLHILSAHSEGSSH